MNNDPDTLSLCNCDGLWHIGAPDAEPAIYLDDYVANQRQEAIQEFAENVLSKLRRINEPYIYGDVSEAIVMAISDIDALLKETDK